MKQRLFDPTGSKWFLYDNTINFAGRTGLGDVMLGLNTAFYVSNYINQHVDLNFYWKTDRDWSFHFEDPDTLVECQEFLVDKMHGFGSVDVSVTNIFNAEDIPIKGRDLHSGIERPDGYATLSNVNTWLFQERYLQVPIHEKLVVVWHPKLIRTDMPSFKKSYDQSYWDLIIPLLKSLGYTVCEIDYRTPIREAFYLISRCRFVVAYNGVFHYLSKNLCKPMIVMGDSGILKTHNPQAKHFFAPHKDETERTLLDYIINIEENLVELDTKVDETKSMVYPVVYGKEYEKT